MMHAFALRELLLACAHVILQLHRLKLARIRQERYIKTTAAVTLLQALARGHIARHYAAASPSDRTAMRARVHAHRTLQRCYRGYRARCAVRQLALQRLAAEWEATSASSATADSGSSS